MTKITVDKGLIEQAIDAAFSPYCTQDLAILVPALRAALAESAVEPVAWWIVNKTTDEKFVTTRPGDWNNLNWLKCPLYTSPPPPAEVPLLTHDEMVEAHPVLYGLPADDVEFARGIEQAVRQKAGLK